MKVTSINRQAKKLSRYSIFVDNKYAFSLSETALLETRLAVNKELDEKSYKKLKQLSSDDKLYSKALSLVTTRPKTGWEVETYLKRKAASPALIKAILNKLSGLNLVNDRQYAESFINDRLTLRPTSRRKIINELRKRRIDEETITEAISNLPETDPSSLKAVIQTKRRQVKYQDDLKLMQYLARQGFNYGDIKAALSNNEDT